MQEGSKEFITRFCWVDPRSSKTPAESQSQAVPWKDTPVPHITVHGAAAPLRQCCSLVSPCALQRHNQRPCARCAAPHELCTALHTAIKRLQHTRETPDRRRSNDPCYARTRATLGAPVVLAEGKQKGGGVSRWAPSQPELSTRSPGVGWHSRCPNSAQVLVFKSRHGGAAEARMRWGIALLCCCAGWHVGAAGGRARAPAAAAISRRPRQHSAQSRDSILHTLRAVHGRSPCVYVDVGVYLAAPGRWVGCGACSAQPSTQHPSCCNTPQQHKPQLCCRPPQPGLPVGRLPAMNTARGGGGCTRWVMGGLRTAACRPRRRPPARRRRTG
jgi:hypothetical protein